MVASLAKRDVRLLIAGAVVLGAIVLLLLGGSDEDAARVAAAVPPERPADAPRIEIGPAGDEPDAAQTGIGPAGDGTAPLAGEGSAEIVPGVSITTFHGDLDEMRERTVIRALVTPSRTDFFSLNGRLLGIQAELLRRYEEFVNAGLARGDLHTRIVFIPVPFDELIPALLDGHGDIAAAMLTATAGRAPLVDIASAAGYRVDEVVVSAPGAEPIGSVEDLAGKTVYVVSGSSYREHLEALDRRLTHDGHGRIRIVTADSRLRDEDILEMVDAGIVEYTVVDDYMARLWANVFTGMTVHGDVRVAEGNRLGWAVRPTNPKLAESLDAFARTIRRGTLLGNMLVDRYLRDTRFIENPFDEENLARFREFSGHFQRYGEMYGFDWLALVAQAYRESGLDHSRRGRTGAVGIMQIRPSTAAGRNVGIPDVSSVEDNIHAGARYMAFIRDRYFSGEELSEMDRMAFNWAAYNAGPGKVRRMRDRAGEMGLDPDVWFGNVEYAALDIVGQETVRYVANVYKYYVAYSLMQRWGDGGVTPAAP